MLPVREDAGISRSYLGELPPSFSDRTAKPLEFPHRPFHKERVDLARQEVDQIGLVEAPVIVDPARYDGIDHRSDLLEAQRGPATQLPVPDGPGHGLLRQGQRSYRS